MNNLKTVLQDSEGKDIKEASYDMQFQRKLLHAIFQDTSTHKKPGNNFQITIANLSLMIKRLEITLYPLSLTKPSSTLKTKTTIVKTSLVQELLTISFYP